MATRIDQSPSPLSDEATESLIKLGRALSDEPDLSAAFERVAEIMRSVIPWDRLVISSVDIDADTLVDAYIEGLRLEGRTESDVRPLASTIAEYFIDHPNTLLLNDQTLNNKTGQVSELEIVIDAGLRSGISIPLRSRNKLVGVLHIRAFAPDAYSSRDVVFAEALGLRLAGPLASEQLRLRLERSALEESVLAEIGRIMISSLEVADVFPDCADQIARLIQFDRLAIVLVDEDAGTKTDAYSVGVEIPGQEPGTVTPLANSIVEEILESSKPLLLGASELAERAERYPGTRARVDHGLNSLIAVPLLSRGRPIGYLNIRSRKDGAYGADDIKLATLIAAQIAGSVAASILYARSEQESASRKGLAEIGRIITSSHDVDAVLERFAVQARELIPFDRIVISLLEPDGETVVDTFVSGVEISGHVAGIRYVVDETSHRAPVRQRVTVTSQSDGKVEIAREIDAQKWAVMSGLRSQLITPLISQGDVIGTLSLRSKSEDAYGSNEIQIIEQISDHIAGAISISRLYQSLQESEQHYRDLFENAEDMIQTADLDGNILYANQSWLKGLGYELGDIGSMTISDIVHPDSQDEYQNLIARIIGGESVGEFDSVFETKTGKKVFVRGTANCGFDKGQPVSTHGIFRDVSARLEMERMKEEFVSMVSHELRTPLTSIRGSLGMLASGQLEDKPDQVKRMLEIASANTDRLSRLIDDILDIQRIEAPVIDIVLAAIDVQGLIEQATEEMRSFADEAMVKLETHACPAWVMADHDRIVQTLTNLISNAVKFSEPGSTVEVGCHEETDHVTFTVSDTGRGIPSEKIDTIFERFQQVDSSDSRDKGGTGLGLAICKLIVEQHGGTLTVESKMGVGSTFRFQLNRAPDSDIPVAH